MTTTDGVQERWLECQLDKGMFSDELAVTYPPQGEALCSVFVPIDLVRGKPGARGRVRVKVIKREGKTLAWVPSPEQRTIIPVAEQDLAELP